MATTLSDAQRKYAQHHLLFDRPLSMEMNEAIFRASIARADNERTETGLPELFCALYLQYRGELENYFDGVPELVKRIFAKHRFDVEGLSPEQAVASAANEQEDTGGTGVVWDLRLSDDAVQLLWQASRFANIVGKKASLKDVLAALTVRAEWLNELRQLGVTLKSKLTNLSDVVFFTWAHTGSNWPTEAQFSADDKNGPFVASLTTPSGGFLPVRSATIKLNDKEVATLKWPSTPTMIVAVELRDQNRIAWELDGPQFGSMEIIIRRDSVDSAR